MYSKRHALSLKAHTFQDFEALEGFAKFFKKEKMS